MADSPPHEIIVIQKGRTEDWEHLRQQCFDIRVQVFHHEQKFPLDTEFDELVSSPLSPFPLIPHFHFSSSSSTGKRYLTPSSYFLHPQTRRHRSTYPATSNSISHTGGHNPVYQEQTLL